VNKLTPQVGQIVKVLRGRDPGEYAVVVGIADHRFVWLADGVHRKFDQPKKKNLNHLQIQDTISSEVESSIRETGRVNNGKLRHAIAKFVELMQDEALEKGD
jgi:large subunit ribosomal protein L14e